MPELRKNLQVKQPNIAHQPEGNGWPEPLVDNGPMIRQVVNVGKKGESIQKNVPIQVNQDK